MPSPTLGQYPRSIHASTSESGSTAKLTPLRPNLNLRAKFIRRVCLTYMLRHRWARLRRLPWLLTSSIDPPTEQDIMMIPSAPSVRRLSESPPSQIPVSRASLATSGGPAGAEPARPRRFRSDSRDGVQGTDCSRLSDRVAPIRNNGRVPQALPSLLRPTVGGHEQLGRCTRTPVPTPTLATLRIPTPAPNTKPRPHPNPIMKTRASVETQDLQGLKSPPRTPSSSAGPIGRGNRKEILRRKFSSLSLSSP